MAGSSFGTIFRLTTWGESHGKGVGVVVDGVPAGLSLSEEDIQFYLDRRKPGPFICWLLYLSHLSQRLLI